MISGIYYVVYFWERWFLGVVFFWLFFWDFLEILVFIFFFGVVFIVVFLEVGGDS